MKGRINVVSKMLMSADLDAELEAGLPILEIAGTERLLIENHQAVTGYSCDSICVKVNYGSISICGSNLIITKMTKGQLVICGNIHSVHLTVKG